jgi:hypothetical protein
LISFCACSPVERRIRRHQGVQKAGYRAPGSPMSGALRPLMVQARRSFEVAFGIEPQRKCCPAAILQRRTTLFGDAVRKRALLADHFWQGHIAMNRNNFAALFMAHVVPAEIVVRNVLRYRQSAHRSAHRWAGAAFAGEQLGFSEATGLRSVMPPRSFRNLRRGGRSLRPGGGALACSVTLAGAANTVRRKFFSSRSEM